MDEWKYQAMLRAWLELLYFLELNEQIKMEQALYLVRVLRSPQPLDRDKEIFDIRMKHNV